MVAQLAPVQSSFPGLMPAGFVLHTALADFIRHFDYLACDVHCLRHIPEDVRAHGSDDELDRYPYETCDLFPCPANRHYLARFGFDMENGEITLPEVIA